MKDFVLFVAGVGEMHIFKFDIGELYICPLFGFGQFGHLEEFLKIFDGELDLPHIFREDLELCERADHRDRKHYGKCRLCCCDCTTVCERERDRKRTDQSGREECETQLHCGEGGTQPFDDKSAEIGDGSGVFFIAYAGSAEGLDYLDTFYVLHDRAVHVVCRFVVFIEVLSADLEGQSHTYK